MRPRTFLAAALGLLLPSAALAGAPIDRIEHLFGATYMTAQTGNGGLTAGVGPRGEVTVLSWPSPSFHDQVDFRTEASARARSLPRFGARESEGIYTGLRVRTTAGETLTWLHDSSWSHEQTYAGDASAAVEQRATHEGFGLTVRQWTAVDHDRDVVLRRTEITRDARSRVESVDFVLYANPAPKTTRDPLDPREDDGMGDFLAYWDPAAEAVLHYRPHDPDPGPLDPVFDAQVQAPDRWEEEVLPRLREALAGELPSGAALAFGGAVAPDAFQVGRDLDTPCTLPVLWGWLPDDALDELALGALSGSPIAGCRTNHAQSWAGELGEAGVEARLTFDTFWAAAATPDEAVDLLVSARTEGFDAALARTDAAWEAFLAPLHLPEALGAEAVAFARRTLVSIKQGTDRVTGAIVASIATQPAYHLDWPRDGAFLDIALDVSGQPEAVERHQRFTASTQNRRAIVAPEEEGGLLRSPPGAWLMHHYADGQPATTLINTFEIDQVGLALWGFWSHAPYAPTEARARDALAAAWPAIERGANLLAACVDDAHPSVPGDAPAGRPAWWPVYEALLAGTIPDPDARAAAMAAGDWEALRPCEANEDDNPVHSVSLYSTHVTRMGLLAAVRAARTLCVDDPVVDYWEARAHELGGAAFALYYDDDAGRWTSRADWLLWPEPIDIDPSLDAWFSSAGDEETRRAEVAAFVDRARRDYAVQALEGLRAELAGEGDGASYQQKRALNLARFWADRDPAQHKPTEAAHDAVRALTEDFPLPGTRHVGEVWVNLDEDGDGIIDGIEQRTAVPHLWTAALTYLSAMAVAAPERFLADGVQELGPLCETGVEPDLVRSIDDCSSGPTCGGDSAAAWVLVALFGPLARRRRRRR